MHWTPQKTTWMIGVILELAIAALVLIRKIWRVYPAFGAYVIWEALRTLWLFAIGNSSEHFVRYFYTYWITECISSLLGFVVVREIFSKALSAQLGLQRWGATLFWWSLTMLICIAVLTAIGGAGSDPSRLVAAILLLKRVESFVRLGLIAALFVFVFALGIPWADPVIGIAAGFGIYGAGELVAYAIRTSWGPRARTAFSWTIVGIGLCQEILWLAYFVPRRHAAGKVDVADALGAKSELEKLHDAVEVILER